MSLKKQYNEKLPLCKVTFKVAKDITNWEKLVNLVGDFNNWNVESIPMKKQKNGDFTVSLDLIKGKEYQFKYLVDGAIWMNDTDADKFVPNAFQNENSVIIL